jgi:hypothetical protein
MKGPNDLKKAACRTQALDLSLPSELFDDHNALDIHRSKGNERNV